MVNIDLLLEQLRRWDVVDLIQVCLRDQYFNLSSNPHRINTGTIQDSILGPIFYSIYVSPLFDLTDFADDNFILAIHTNK